MNVIERIKVDLVKEDDKILNKELLIIANEELLMILLRELVGV
jgi:hypothetical protein